MMIYPPSATTALGFTAIRGALGELVYSDVGLVVLANESPARDLDEQQRRLNLVAELQSLLRFDDPFSLSGLSETQSLLARVGPEGSFLEGEELRRILSVISCARIVRSYLEARQQKYPLLKGYVSGLADLKSTETYIDLRIDERGSVRENASPQLRALTRQRIRTEATLHRALQTEQAKANANGFAAEGQPTIRGGRLVLPIRAEAKRKVQGFVHDVSATGQTVFIEPASCLDANNDLISLDADIRREIVAILKDVTASVVAVGPSIKRNTELLAGLDVLAAKAKLANKLGAVVPAVSDDGVVELIDARNPELVLAAGAEDSTRSVVPLDLVVGGTDRILIVTGPNAGGKTVALKTVGLFAIMLSYGIPVPTDERSRFPFVAKLLVDIGDEQSVENDLSTYSAHMVRLAAMTAEADRDSIVLIDEAGTGTDPIEGGAIAQAVLESLADSGALTIATTHHNALKAFAHDTPGIVNGSMVFDLSTLSPTFRFRMGVPGSSYGLEIARRSGIPDNVLVRARELVGDDARSVEELLSTLEARIEGLQEQQERFERSSTEAEHSQAKFEERATRLREEKDRILNAAQAEGAQILKGANARIERTIREIREAQAEKSATREVREQLDRARAKLEDKVSAAEARAIESANQESRNESGQNASGGGGSSKKSETRKARSGNKLRSGSLEENGPASGPIQVGDQVVIDDSHTAVEVLSIARKEAELAFTAGRMRVKLSRLTKVSGPRKQSVNVTRVRPQNERGDVVASGLQHKIDLRGSRVDEAIGEVTRLIDEAIAAGLQSVEILHGKGTGALRKAIRENLLARSDVRTVEDAPIEAGGAGITVVTI